MNVLVIGGGGREHALCWALSRDATVFCAPGNPGTAGCATNVSANPSDSSDIISLIHEHRIDLTVVGPEAPLAEGLADALIARGYPVFGPTGAAARIEASKAFAKDVMEKAGVPTAGSRTFQDHDQALQYIAEHPEPLVVKASGLAAGKGAVVCATREEALDAAAEMFSGRFGDAGLTVVIEEFMDGEELSVFAITDGEHVVVLPGAQDHKRLLENDLGPNTGGMGAYSPVSLATPELIDRVEKEVLRPTLHEMARLGAPYQGFLYAGLMIRPDGTPSVVEFNCRFGDPEAQVVLPILDANLLELLWGVAGPDPWNPGTTRVGATGAAVTTVLASTGYPDAPRKGDPISVPDHVEPDQILFHAGTRLDGSNLVTSGGRVLCATGLGPDVPAAAEASRRLATSVSFADQQYRSDIGWREIERFQQTG